MKHLKILDIYSNPFTVEGVVAICSSPYVKNLMEINFGHSVIGKEGIHAIVSTFKLKRLEIYGGCIGNEGMNTISNSPNMVNLELLNVQKNEISTEGAKSLENSEYLKQLTKLDISRNGGCELLSSHILTNVNTLKLGSCKIGEHSIQCLTNNSHCKNLSSLSLMYNSIGSKGAGYLATSEILENLTRLDLHANNPPIGDEGIQLIGNVNGLLIILVMVQPSKKMQSRDQQSFIDIPLDIWRYGIFEYWLGPILATDLLHLDVMKFKREVYSQIVKGLDLETIRVVHRVCCAVSKRFTQILMENDDYWRKVSNIFEMVIYWKRYESSEKISLAIGDMSVEESVPIVEMQKMIEATEMNSNREYSDIIDPSQLRSNYSNMNINEIENNINTVEMHQLFEKRMQHLMVSEDKFETIKNITQLNGYDLFLHKALILSLEMISHFDSEKFSAWYTCNTTFETCRLMSDELYTNNLNDSQALGLMIDMENDFSVFEKIASHLIVLSINLREMNYHGFVVPDHIQYLCFSFSQILSFGDSSTTPLLYSDFLEDQDIFPNVRDLTIRIENPDYDMYWEHSDTVEKNILSGITRKRFPKLVRISIQGIANVDNLLEWEILGQLLYLEIIPFSRDDDGLTTNWSNRKVHNLIRNELLGSDSLLNHLIIHANISRHYPEADYNSIKEYYDISRDHFVASISRSSIDEYYENCYE